MEEKKTKHGGARKGAGRPFGTKRKGKTKVKRIPVALESVIDKLIKEHSDNQ